MTAHDETAAAETLRRDIGRISQTRIDGMPTHVLAAALAAEGWVKARPLLDEIERRVWAEASAFNPHSRAYELVSDMQALLDGRR